MYFNIMSMITTKFKKLFISKKIQKLPLKKRSFPDGRVEYKKPNRVPRQ